MEVSEALRKRRMTRNFSGRPLDGQVVDDLLAAALRSPSAGNTQGCEFVVLEGPTETATYWDATTDQAWRDRSRRFEGLSRAPVIVLPFADPEAYRLRYEEPDKHHRGDAPVNWIVPFWFVDLAFATMAILVGAADRRLGAAFLGNFRGQEALRHALAVPEHFVWLGAILLGEPALPDPPSTSTARPRRTLEECVHRGGW
jgi:nitroreductase